MGGIVIYTDAEEWAMLSQEDLEGLSDCKRCGSKILRQYKGFDIHRHCWLEGKEEHDNEDGGYDGF